MTSTFLRLRLTRAAAGADRAAYFVWVADSFSQKMQPLTLGLPAAAPVKHHSLTNFRTSSGCAG